MLTAAKLCKSGRNEASGSVGFISVFLCCLSFFPERKSVRPAEVGEDDGDDVDEAVGEDGGPECAAGEEVGDGTHSSGGPAFVQGKER